VTKKKIVIWGATGQSLVLEEILRNEFDILAFFDRMPVQTPIPGVPIFEGIDGFNEWKTHHRPEGPIHFIVAIGGDRGFDRLGIHRQLQSSDLRPVNAIHPSAFVAYNALLSEGVQLLANSSVCVRASLGTSVIVNTAASVDHECVLEDGVHIGPGAKLAGCVAVGEYSFIGTGAVVLPRIRIGKNCIVGAGSVVTRDLPDHVVAYGNPCKIVKPNQNTH
jgi:sugar O-acyltransferase (sialic acid O-acetyltransferase NeuD family)